MTEITLFDLPAPLFPHDAPTDPRYHRGTIYKLAGAQPMYRTASGEPIPGPSGKYGWAWPLPKPAWGWEELTDIQPRTLRMF